MAEFAPDIRGVLIPITGGRVLLPNATVAEVITYKAPTEPHEGGDWLMGRLSWRGWRIPMFSFAKLAGTSDEEEISGAKIAVLKALGGRPDLPFMAMIAQGFPRLTTITPDNLSPMDEDENELPDGVLSRVIVADQDAVIPDMEGLERLVVDGLGD